MRVLCVLLLASCAVAVPPSESSPFSQNPHPTPSGGSTTLDESDDSTSDRDSENADSSTGELDGSSGSVPLESTSGQVPEDMTSGTSTGMVDSTGEPGSTSTSSSTGDESSTGGDASTSTGTTDDTTSGGSTGTQEGPMQPAIGLYAQCGQNGPECDPYLTDGCFQLFDENMAEVDGFCTLFCESNLDCGSLPGAACALQVENPPKKACAITCNKNADCPQDMICQDLKQAGKFCF